MADHSLENAGAFGKLGEFHAPSQNVHICALLPEIETVASTLQCAIAAGRDFSAEICAVHVGFDAAHSFVDAEEEDIQQLRDLAEGGRAARTARIKAAVEAFQTAAPAQAISWHDDEGDIAANVVRESYAASLVVIGRPRHLDASDALHSLLFDAHRLALLAPPAAPAAIGRHIVVGWKPGKAVMETVDAALPWLRKAERISVVWAPRAGAPDYDDSARAFFARLGLDVAIMRLAPSRARVAAQLLAAAAERDGDCLLVGANRHAGLWQAMFGGVTRDLLARAELPVFMMRAA